MKKPEKNWLEWVIFGGSVVIVFATVGALIYECVTLAAKPPDPQVTLGEPEARGSYFAVPVTVANKGDGTAEGVHLEVKLSRPGGETEQSEFDLPYLPRRATRHGWVTFSHDPREGQLDARVVGYRKP